MNGAGVGVVPNCCKVDTWSEDGRTSNQSSVQEARGVGIAVSMDRRIKNGIPGSIHSNHNGVKIVGVDASSGCIEDCSECVSRENGSKVVSIGHIYVEIHRMRIVAVSSHLDYISHMNLQILRIETHIAYIHIHSRHRDTSVPEQPVSLR